MTSPCFSPASAAGLPLSTAVTSTPCPLLVAATWTPRKAEPVVGVGVGVLLPPLPFPLSLFPLPLPLLLRGLNGNTLLPLPLPPRRPNRSRSACCRPPLRSSCWSRSRAL